MTTWPPPKAPWATPSVTAMPQVEYILCAAIWYKGRVPFCGYRHRDIITLFEKFLPDRAAEVIADESNRGFLTNKNRFVDRTDGYKIAKAANQLRIIHDDTPILTSEDLY